MWLADPANVISVNKTSLSGLERVDERDFKTEMILV